MSKTKEPVSADSLPYRPCVGVMVLNSEGLVWVGRRLSENNSESDGSPQLWQMPQGGIDKDEDALVAARRELFEETGMRSVTLLGECKDWINYDLPAHLIGIGLKGKYRGQAQRWFAFRFDGDDSEINIEEPPSGQHQEFDAWDWKPMAELPNLIVSFKREVYQKVVAEFSHLSKRPA
ncbi:RNA pyrophosphohydrolase [Neorhizobium sp. JUb45]|uniref:RNA pyrophosphohydrolase n=1 Tax=unclassified Neorhizobium TaxID=2629175 RepID=UPI001047B17E|nr:RNA pyrophosphohydrolase [Neorhizobium sp. JUb45]TCQ99698.1 putative (di)nucleoside polyphosphate hydrolase [Neorhizobium sp. JUb45]